MDTKHWLPNTIVKLKSIGKTLSHILLIAIAMIAGFFIGYYYWVMMNKTHDSPLKRIKQMNTTSVAINERNELMIIDRANGNYVVYQDSVGMTIFTLYANKKYEQVVTVDKPQ